jgi:hypothetical protein
MRRKRLVGLLFTAVVAGGSLAVTATPASAHGCKAFAHTLAWQAKTTGGVGDTARDFAKVGTGSSDDVHTFHEFWCG